MSKQVCEWVKQSVWSEMNFTEHMLGEWVNEPGSLNETDGESEWIWDWVNDWIMCEVKCMQVSKWMNEWMYEFGLFCAGWMNDVLLSDIKEGIRLNKVYGSEFWSEWVNEWMSKWNDVHCSFDVWKRTWIKCVNGFLGVNFGQVSELEWQVEWASSWMNE